MEIDEVKIISSNGENIVIEFKKKAKVLMTRTFAKGLTSIQTKGNSLHAIHLDSKVADKLAG